MLNIAFQFLQIFIDWVVGLRFFNQKPKVIVIDGVISAGKTVLIDLLYDHLKFQGKNVVRVKEPVEEWKRNGMLAAFYSDMKRWSYMFQTMTFHDGITENIKAYETGGRNVDYYILERSPYSNRLFMNLLYKDGMVTDLEMDMYNKWADMWQELMPYKINLMVYLRPDTEICMQRLKVRGNKEESSVSVEYQISLRDQHDNFYNNVSKNIWKVRIDTNIDYKNDELGKRTILNRFDKILNSKETAYGVFSIQV